MIATFSFASRQGTLPEAPWVMGDPTSTYKWQVAVAGKGRKGKGKRNSKSETLENITLNIFLDVKSKEAEAGFLGGLRGGQLEENIDTLLVARTVLRALHKAKYGDVEAITGDKQTLYYSKVDDKSFREIVEELKHERGSSYTQIKIKAAHGSSKIAYADIKKNHAKRKAPINIAFQGKISASTLNTFIGYMKKNLPVREVLF